MLCSWLQLLCSSKLWTRRLVVVACDKSQTCRKKISMEVFVHLSKYLCSSAHIQTLSFPYFIFTLVQYLRALVTGYQEMIDSLAGRETYVVF